LSTESHPFVFPFYLTFPLSHFLFSKDHRDGFVEDLGAVSGGPEVRIICRFPESRFKQIINPFISLT